MMRVLCILMLLMFRLSGATVNERALINSTILEERLDITPQEAQLLMDYLQNEDITWMIEELEEESEDEYDEFA